MAGQEDDEGIDALIKQKISRPAFARVISHELTRSPDEVKQSKITISRILKQLQVTCLVVSVYVFACVTVPGGGTHPRKVRVGSAEVIKMKLYVYKRAKKGGIYICCQKMGSIL